MPAISMISPSYAITTDFRHITSFSDSCASMMPPPCRHYYFSAFSLS
jgi:hypothetical protein